MFKTFLQITGGLESRIPRVRFPGMGVGVFDRTPDWHTGIRIPALSTVQCIPWRIRVGYGYHPHIRVPDAKDRREPVPKRQAVTMEGKVRTLEQVFATCDHALHESDQNDL